MTTPALRIAISGALGRMGQAVAAVMADAPGLVLAARIDSGVGEVLTAADRALGLSDVVVDFSAPDASVALAQAAARQTKEGLGAPALVIGTTGFTPAQVAAIDAAAARVPIVRAGNFSLGVNMLMGLVEQAARALPAEAWDIEVFEAHHRRKVDAPSGTALMLGQAAAAGRAVDLATVRGGARDGVTGPRTPGSIGFAVQRGGGVVGEHAVSFFGEDEILTLSHSARDRSLFARGALAAARWVAGKPPGAYDMRDVLGFR